jgi:hypothetical protein
LLFVTVVSQAYDVKFWEEYVLRGNAAILKCQIPSFVAEYVSVKSWIISEDDNEQEISIDETSDLGTAVNRFLQLLSFPFPFPISSYGGSNRVVAKIDFNL